MLVKEHNCIFFHSGKTAGTAIEFMLTGKNLDYRKFDTDYIWGFNGEMMTQHATAKHFRELMDFCSYPREVWDNAFKFTAVRNPYNRIVSVYYYLFGFLRKKYDTFEAFVMHLPEIVRAGDNPKGSHYLPQYDYAYIDGEKMTINRSISGLAESEPESWRKCHSCESRNPQIKRSSESSKKY